ncbi:MAG: hypothetical protein FWD26_11120 [Treponema sp.]|nr:hypothetical protein [Treponema sp.]
MMNNNYFTANQHERLEKIFTTNHTKGHERKNKINYIVRVCLLLIFFSLIPAFLFAQTTDEQRFPRRIVWRGGEHALRYAVQIERSANGRYQNYLREFTSSLYINVSLPAGEYRFRIYPHDILDRPGDPTHWVYFEIKPEPITEPSDILAEEPAPIQPIIIIADDRVTDPEEKQEELVTTPEEKQKLPARYNTLGASVGTSFTDPLIIATLHGSYAFFDHFFAEVGCDFGFLSIYDDVERFFCLYPFVNAGFFMPINRVFAVYASIGAGYMFGSYTFSYGKVDVNIFAINFTAGVNLFNFLNISYTLRTNFNKSSNKFAIGYVYRTN